MLESMDNMTLCGVITNNDSYEDIYCDDCGVLVFESYSDGACWCLTEINIGTPLKLTSTQPLINNMENGVYGDCVGVIYSSTGNIIVLTDEEYAVTRSIAAPGVDVGEKFYYNTDEEYEIDMDDINYEED